MPNDALSEPTTKTADQQLYADQIMLLLRLMAAQMVDLSDKIGQTTDLMLAALDEIANLGAEIAENQGQ